MLTPDGKGVKTKSSVKFTRDLAHPHVNEQRFPDQRGVVQAFFAEMPFRRSTASLPPPPTRFAEASQVKRLRRTSRVGGLYTFTTYSQYLSAGSIVFISGFNSPKIKLAFRSLLWLYA